MSETDTGIQSREEQRERVYEAAFRLFSSSPDWVTFFRQVLGLNGLIRQTYTTPESLAEFERSDTYADILQMLTRLRERISSSKAPQEPTRVITVRLPKSLHEALRVEAHERQTSMNKLCISKLVQFIESGLIPKEGWQAATMTPTEQTAEKKGAGVDL